MMFQRIIQFVLAHKISISVLLSITLLAGTGQILRHLQVDNSLAIWFLEDNQDYQEYLQFQKEQGSDEVIIAMIPTDDALAQKHITQLQSLHQQTDTLPYVQSTFSLANAKYPIYSNRKIYYRNIYRENQPRENIVNVLTDLPALNRQLITEDKKASFFYLQLKPNDQIEANRKQIVSNLENLIANSFPTSHVSGAPVLNEAFNKTIYQESIFFAVLSVLVILGLLLFLLPHWQYLPIAFLAIIFPVTFTLGLMGSFGYSLNLISMLIPTILMIYSISDLIHITNIFHLHRKAFPTQSRIEQIKHALQQSLKPCFYTTLTTIIGYLALTLSPLPAFRSMGLFTFIGMLMAFILVYIIAAIGFYYLSEKSLAAKVRKINLAALTNRINHWTTKYNGASLSTGVMIFILGIGSLFFIEVNTNSLNLLGSGKVKDDLTIIENKLAGSTRLQLNISSTQQASLLHKDILTKLQSFQEKLDAHPLLSHPISIVNFQAFLKKRMAGLSSFNTIDFEKVLKNSKNDSNAFFSLFAENYDYLAININIKELDTKDLEILLSDIKKEFSNHFSASDYTLQVHGFSALYAQLNNFILQTQFRSFGAAFLLSFAILFYFIGRLKTSLLALIPNLIPLFATLIIMALFGIPLESANAMLAPIMLGVAMDDTIHLINKFKHYQAQKLSVEQSIDQALQYTGGALFSTTISLVCGFLIVGLSGVISVSTFGLLCAFTILVALLADVLFLPALFKRML